MEYWFDIHEFPGYEVSSLGRVRNKRTSHILLQLMNNRRLRYVGLVKRGVQHKRSVSRLVARACLADPPNDAYDTPIHLDGDRENNEAHNLMWRPRWFARNYHNQFKIGPRSSQPVEEVRTEEYFETPWEAVIKYGLLEVDILYSTHAFVPVWPTRQRFRFIEIPIY